MILDEFTQLSIQIQEIQKRLSSLELEMVKPTKQSLTKENLLLMTRTQIQALSFHDILLACRKTQVVVNTGKGDCLFLSLGYLLDIDPTILRLSAISFIIENYEHYKNYLLKSDGTAYKNSEEYFNIMSSPTSYGDHVVLEVLCKLYRVNAFIVVLGSQGKLEEPIYIKVEGGRDVFLKFTKEYHYEAIE